MSLVANITHDSIDLVRIKFNTVFRLKTDRPPAFKIPSVVIHDSDTPTFAMLMRIGL